MSIINSASLYADIMRASIDAPEDLDGIDYHDRHLTFKTATGSIKLIRTKARLQQFAADMLKTWKLWGGGEKPASDKPKKAPSQWKAGTVRVVAELLEDGDYSAALELAERECGGIVCQSEAGEQFLFYAREQIEGMPEGVEVGKTCAGNWVVAHGKTGRVILNTRGKVKTKASALAMFARARAPWSAEDFAEGLARLTACDFESARATWMMQNGIAPAPESLPPVADAAPVEALPVPEVAPVDAAAPEVAPVQEQAPEAQPEPATTLKANGYLAPVAPAADPAPADLQDVHDAPSVAPVATPKHLQRFSLLSNDEAMLRIKNAGFDVVERMSKNNDGIRKIRLHLSQGNTTFYTSITLPAACDIVEWLEAQAQKLKNGSLIYGANLLSHIASPAQVATPEPVQNVAPPVVQKAEELTPRVAALEEVSPPVTTSRQQCNRQRKAKRRIYQLSTTAPF